ncbi:MAG: HD domain-containing protein [Victivallaceae bacterium]|nr:HD domain-containing protein [Victivallaceae bacterium]
MSRKKSGETAVIDIGSSSVRMDILASGKSGMRVIDSMAMPTGIGYDVFRKGNVSPGSLSQLVGTLVMFRDKLREYGLRDAYVFATSALREAFNRELAVSMIRQKTGFNAHIMESTMEITTIYLAIRHQLEETGVPMTGPTLISVTGAGSMFVVFCDGGLMRFCEEIPLRSARIYDSIGRSSVPADRLVDMLRAANLPQRLRECTGFDKSTPISLVLAGENARLLAAAVTGGKPPAENEISAPSIERLRQFTAGEWSPSSPLRTGDAGGAELETRTVGYFLGLFKCAKVIVPGVTTRSAVMEELYLPPGYMDIAFAEDLRSVCDAIGRKYGYFREHAEAMRVICSAIMKNIGGDSTFPPEASRLVDVASYLHDIGRFVDTRRHHRHSEYLIANMQIPGISMRELKIISLLARYHRRSVPKESHPEYMALRDEDKVLVQKLAAVIRVADALDCAHCKRFSSPKITRSGLELRISSSDGDVRAEKLAIKAKGDLFADVFGLKIILE